MIAYALIAVFALAVYAVIAGIATGTTAIAARVRQARAYRAYRAYTESDAYRAQIDALRADQDRWARTGTTPPALPFNAA